MTKEEVYIKVLTRFLTPLFPLEKLDWAIKAYMSISEKQEVIYEAMQVYADQEITLYSKRIKGKKKKSYDFLNDEEYRHNSNC